MTGESRNDLGLHIAADTADRAYKPRVLLSIHMYPRGNTAFLSVPEPPIAMNCRAVTQVYPYVQR